MTPYGNLQNASQPSRTGRWSLCLPGPYNRWDRMPSTWTWTEDTVKCVASPRITNPTKMSTVTGSEESHVHGSLSLRGYSLCTAVANKTKVNAVYHRNFKGHYLRPTSFIRTCYITWHCSLSQCQHSDWFGRKVEMGSSGTSNILTGYEPVWLRPFREVKEILRATWHASGREEQRAHSDWHR